MLINRRTNIHSKFILKLRMKGEQDLDELLEYAPTYVPSSKRKDKKEEKTKKSKGISKNTNVFPCSKLKKESIEKLNMIKQNKVLNPIETFVNILQCYENDNFDQNVYFQCISFILQCPEEQVIPPGQQKEINTNFLFGNFKLTKKNSKKEIICDKLHNMLRYYISNDIVTDKHVRTLFKAGCISELMGELVKVTVLNNSVHEYMIPQGSIVAKIFIYAE